MVCSVLVVVGWIHLFECDVMPCCILFFIGLDWRLDVVFDIESNCSFPLIGFVGFVSANHIVSQGTYEIEQKQPQVIWNACLIVVSDTSSA